MHDPAVPRTRVQAVVGSDTALAVTLALKFAFSVTPYELALQI